MKQQKTKIDSIESDEKAETNSPSELDTVRDILFGAMSAAHTNRQQELEQLIKNSINQLRTDNEVRFQKLEKTMAELNQAEANNRQSAEQRIDTELHALNDAIVDLSNTSSTTTTDLQDQLLNQADLTQKQLDNLHEEIMSTLSKELHKLQHDKADRSSLAVLLKGIASELSGSDTSSVMVES